MSELTEALSQLRSEDLRVDALGRVVIANPKISDLIKGGVEGIGPADEALAGNGICCGNTGCASPELVSMLDRLVGGFRR